MPHTYMCIQETYQPPFGAATRFHLRLLAVKYFNFLISKLTFHFACMLVYLYNHKTQADDPGV